jgi:hypothetical protein
MQSMQIKILSRSPYRALLGLAGRVAAYAVLLGLIAAGMLWGAVVYDSAFYDEIGPVETFQTVFAMGAALIFLLAAKVDQERVACSVLISGLFFCVAVRESDYFLDVLVCRHAWKVIVACLLILFTLYALRCWKQVMESVMSFMSESSFGIFISGLLVLIVFSRLFGYGDFWEAIMDDKSYKTVKTIVEEGVELMGYFLLLVSSLEYRHAALMAARQGKETAV